MAITGFDGARHWMKWCAGGLTMVAAAGVCALVPRTAAALVSDAPIAAGWDHACALTAQGGVKCWGYNALGQLGDGTTGTRLSPVNVKLLSSGVIALAAGASHTCALTGADGVKCWGRNAEGELGDGTTTDRHRPVNVQGLASGVIALAAGGYHTCALLKSGGVKCWGDGPLGDGSSTSQPVPVDVVGLNKKARAIGTGFYGSCAVIGDGDLKCW